MAITHSTPADGTFSGTGTTAWDAAHTIAAGTITEAMQVLADNTTNDVSTTAHGYVPKAPNDTTKFLRGDATWAVPSASVTLDGISAAAADQAGIANADWNIRWNWAKATNSEVAFELGESAASTNGTSTAGIPNQVLLQLSTAAASTMSPLKVLSRGTHVFSVSPTTAQVLAAPGSNTAPVYSFAADTDTGIYTATGALLFAVDASNNCGVFNNPGSLVVASGGGAYNVGLEASEVCRLLQATNGRPVLLLSEHAGAVTTGAELRAMKARGTATAPTVITTGDSLMVVSAYGFVGSVNRFQDAGGVTVTSRGTISDSATGIGGIVSVMSAATGAEPVEVANFRAATTTGGGWMTMDEADADPTTTELDSLDAISIYNKNNKFVIAYNNAATITYISIPLDGSTTTWTHSTTAP